MTNINPEYYDNLKAQIDGALNCDDLQAISSKILASINAEKQAILDQLTKLTPIAALLAPPTSPSDVITWIQGLIDTIVVPLYAPYFIYQAQLIAHAAALIEITNAINEKSASLPSCAISV